ncbi:hypothetical protein ACHAWO_007416 [Cyclotella atomus]|uniref:Uncharacterized protein n=1 Tax=Cyclotella atomus TaxID=382360 RepID=A0ABD3QHR6_9STRA
MKRECIAEPQHASSIEPMTHPQDESLFNILYSKIDESRQSFVSMTTTSRVDAHTSLIRDFNTSNKVWSFSFWN